MFFVCANFGAVRRYVGLLVMIMIMMMMAAAIFMILFCSPYVFFVLISVFLLLYTLFIFNLYFLFRSSFDFFIWYYCFSSPCFSLYQNFYVKHLLLISFLLKSSLSFFFKLLKVKIQETRLIFLTFS